MKKDIDSRLYQEYLKGEKESFEILYNKYKNKLVYFIFNIVKDYQKAEDIMQEVFIYVLQNQMKEEYNFKCYLYLVAKSKALNHIKSENRRSNIIQQYFSHKEEEIEKDILEIITKEETKKEILKSINLLGDKYKNAIYLANIEELSYKETADILGISIQNVKTLIHRGKKELKKIMSKENTNKIYKETRVLLIIIGITIGVSGVVFAGVKLYNDYIKKQNQITSRGLFDTGDGITTYEIDLMANDMIWNTDVRLYHKIITNKTEYQKYKDRINEIPNMTEKDFEENFLIIIANENIRQMHEKDLLIEKVIADETTTHIVMKQKENPNYDKENNIWYAVVDKSQLRKNAKVTIENKKIEKEGYTNIKEITDEYSIEQAIQEGCIVLDKNKVISNNLEKLDNFIEKTKTGEIDFIRIYLKYDDQIQIKDVEFENGIYYVCMHTFVINDSQSVKEYYDSYRYLEKRKGNQICKIQYLLYNKKI